MANKLLHIKFALAVFLLIVLSGCNKQSSNSPASGVTSDASKESVSKVSIRTDGKRIYSQSMYVNGDDKPAYTAIFTQENPRDNIQTVHFTNWSEFVNARAALDARFANQTTYSSSSIMTALYFIGGTIKDAIAKLSVVTEAYAATSTYTSSVLIGAGYFPSTKEVLGGASLTTDQTQNPTACFTAARSPQVELNSIVAQANL